MSKNFFYLNSQVAPEKDGEQTGLNKGEKVLRIHFRPGASDGRVELEEMMEKILSRILGQLRIVGKGDRIGSLKIHQKLIREM